MSHRTLHLLEKLQVELAALLALVAVYALIAPGLMPADPEQPITFVPGGRFGSLLRLAGLLWLVAAGCSLLTMSTRPEGTIVAALLGAAGVSMYSPPLRGLLWTRVDGVAGVFLQMQAEVLLMFVVLLGMAFVVAATRAALAVLLPRLRWRSPVAHLPGADPHGKVWRVPSKEELAKSEGAQVLGMLVGPLAVFEGILRSLGLALRGKGRGRATRRQLIVVTASFLVVGLFIAIACMFLLLRSPDRGQILFAQVAGFFVAVLVAHQFFATPLSLAAWIMPVVAALLLYGLAAAATAGGGPDTWAQIPQYARALPIDWMTAGCGGAVLGYWTSERIHEAKHIEEHAASEGA